MEQFTFSLLLGVALFSGQHTPANAFVKMLAVVNQIETQTDSRIVNLTCVLHQPGSLTNQTIDCNIDFFRPIKDLKILVSYYNVALNGAMKNAFVKRQINACLFLLRPNSDRLLKSMFDYIKKHGHLPSRCPIAPGSYALCDIRSAEFPVPAFLPESEFIFELLYNMDTRQEPVMVHRFYGKLRRIVDKIFK